MQRLKQIFVNRWVKILTAILAFMGIAACASEELYGCPSADYKFNGTVKDQKGMRLNNIHVELKAVYNEKETHFLNDVNTDKYGDYLFDLTNQGSYSKFRIICSDPDSVYVADSTTFSVEYKGGDGDWYDGKAEKTVDFVLKKKE